MGWLRVSLEVEGRLAEALGEALLEAGAASVEIVEAGRPAQARRGAQAEGGPSAWARARVSALAEGRSDAAQLVARACALAGLAPTPPHRVRRVPERDWVRRVRAQLRPLRISERLWIVPSGRRVPDPGAVKLVLDPGPAFGTGGHASTRLALAWLERTLRGGETVIDYGCGSGILAIAALKLGAARATGVDIDEQAVLAARRNALQNRVDARFLRADEPLDEAADIVVANILAQPLIVLAPLLARWTAPRGRIALSGLVRAQAREVAAAYEPWFALEVVGEDEGWVLLAGGKRA